MKTTCRVIISGLVQGIGFRYALAKQAESLGVSGFVRNQTDGSVYLEVSGNPEKVSELVRWCHTGPPRAKVERVEVATIDHFSQFPLKSLTVKRFQILR